MRSPRTALALVTIFCLLPLWGAPYGGTVLAQRGSREWTVPVVMEKATVRGRVIILETRKEERKAAANIRIQVWTQGEGAESSTPRGGASNRRLLHETHTDNLGMFTLPELDVGEYLLMVEALAVRLLVVPKAEVRRDQDEPKILLLLLPREALNPAKAA